jgi:Protein of unknown function (DUF3999)
MGLELRPLKLLLNFPVPWMLVFMLGGEPVMADFKRSDWQFLKPISAAAGSTVEYFRFSLDGETFDHSLKSLADLRIVDDQSREVSYALFEEREKTTEEQYAPKIFNRGVLPGQYSTLTLDLEREIPNNTLTLNTKSKNFRRRVEIAGSQDGRQWLVLKHDAYIFDFSGDQKVHLTTIKYPENRHRYLRVRVWNGMEPPLEFDGASLSLVTTTTPRRVSRTSRLFSREEDPKLKASVCVLDLTYRRLPSDFLMLETPEENFSRLVEILSSNDLKAWQTQAQSDFYRFRTSRHSVEKKTLHFPEARHRYLKVIVYNHDDPPLKLTSFEVRGIEKDLIFQFQPGRQYWLYYGNPTALAPQYDIERVKSYLGVEGLPRARLGPQAENAGYRPSGPRKPWTETQPVLFWSVLILLVLGLGAYIFRLMMKVRTAV